MHKLGMLLYSTVDIALRLLVWLIIARCILSFVRHDPHHPVLGFVYEVTEPVMAPFRRLLPSAGGIDFSPILAILVVELVRSLVLNIIASLL
ncbi:MAG: YggT family protein [Syntrophothermaceae bacterium]